jgi:drug/metabolite transporter (DMT)-like permease
MRGGGDGVAARELRDFEREALGERSSPPASSPRRRRFRLFRPGSSLTVPLIERRRDVSSGILRPDDGGGGASGGASGGFTSSAASLAGAKMSDLRASVTVTRRVPWIGWVILSSAVVSLSCVGALVVRQRSMPFAQCAWRAESCVALVAPWAAWTWKTQGARGLRDASVRRTAVVVALCWSGWFVTMFWGLDHTSIPHVYMLTNTTSAIIVAREAAASRFRGVPAAHAVGVALAAAGAALVMWDSDRGHHPGASSAGSPPPSSDGSDDMHLRPPSGRREATLRGDAVVLAGAFAGAGFLVLAKRVRDAVELSHLLLIQMAINLPIVVALAAAFENPNGAFFLRPLDPAGGVFGWLTREQIAPQTFIAVFGTVVGTAGYVASLKYLAATVVAIAMLMEPVLATAVGWLAGANAFPRPVTLAGMALVTAGTFAVVVDAGKKKRTEEAVDATDATSGREEAEVGGGREREGTPSE